MQELLLGIVKTSVLFMLVGYFFWGIIKRDIVFFLRGGSFEGLRFKGIVAVIFSVFFIAFLFFGIYYSLGLPSFNVIQYIFGIIIGSVFSYYFHGMMIYNHEHEPSTIETSKKQFKGDFIFWLIFGGFISLIFSFFAYMISKSILITIGVFFIPFSIVALLGYAFSKFNSGR